MKAIVEEQCLIDIANAIRNKNGSDDTYKPREMAAAISNIQTGIEPTGELTITEPGIYDVTKYASVNIKISNNPGEVDTSSILDQAILGTMILQ